MKVVCINTGYVGEGMMSAAVHGSLFAAPSSNTILAALRAVGSHHPGTCWILYI